jgi:hypothetical protein
LKSRAPARRSRSRATISEAALGIQEPQIQKEEVNRGEDLEDLHPGHPKEEVKEVPTKPNEKDRESQGASLEDFSDDLDLISNQIQYQGHCVFQRFTCKKKLLNILLVYF